MKFIKSIKKTMLVISLAFTAIGVLLIVKKQESTDLIMEILAYGLIVAGLLSMIRYFMINVKDRFKRSDFIIGALLISIATLIFVSKGSMIQIANNILGICMIISGLHKIQDLFDTKACGKNATGTYFAGFVVCAGMGVLVLSNAISNVNALYIVCGLGMCICGISDIVSNFYVANAISKYDETMAELAKVKEEPKDFEPHQEFIVNNVEVKEEELETSVEENKEEPLV